MIKFLIRTTKTLAIILRDSQIASLPLTEFCTASDYSAVVKKYRNPEGGSILFRPIGLTIITEIVATLVKKYPLDRCFELVSKLPTDLTAEPYNGVIWHPTQKRMIGGKALVRNLLLYMLDAYKVIRLIEIDGQAILETQDPGLLPLTPLMKRPNDMDADRWLDECVKATKAADVAPEVLPNLLAVLSIFSSLVYDSEQINQHIPEVMMHEFPLVQHFIEQGIEQGIKQGRQEGHQEGRQEGTEQALTAIAIAMLNDNQPIDTIVKYTGLSEAEIKQLTESVDSTT